jgi:oxygen-dependent protoporphyrinogen oxidase
VKTAIVGAGISGLATAQAILARNPKSEVVVLESSQRVGGKVWSEPTAEGFLCEGGVNGFLDKEPLTLQLCRELALDPLAANLAAAKRYVFSQDALRKLPEKPLEFLFSRLFSLGGRLRVLGEALVGSRGGGDESVKEFACRRLGREAFEKLIDPMSSGVFAGDAAKMSLKSCFPRIHAVEVEYGSLIRGLISLQRQARAAGKSNLPGPGPGGRLTSFTSGMSVLTDTLAAKLGARIRTASPVVGVSRLGKVFSLHLANGESEDADVVILAAPAFAQSKILSDFDPSLAQLTGAIDYPPLTVVCLGYRNLARRRGLDGFGFLVPSREQRSILGAIVDSNVFHGRAPEGFMLLRTMVGGARNPALAELPDERLLDRVRGDLRSMAGIRDEPVFCRVFRHEKAIPQYLVGHAARLEAIDQALQRHPGLLLTGNAYRGVSLNDCVANAWKTAQGLLSGHGAAREE